MDKILIIHLVNKKGSGLSSFWWTVLFLLYLSSCETNSDYEEIIRAGLIKLHDLYEVIKKLK